jgi:hypothetical protein
MSFAYSIYPFVLMFLFRLIYFTKQLNFIVALTRWWCKAITIIVYCLERDDHHL